MSGTLKRTESLPSGLCFVFKPLSIISSPLEPPLAHDPAAPEPSSYSFLAIVLQGFADEEVPSWEEPAPVSLILARSHHIPRPEVD